MLPALIVLSVALLSPPGQDYGYYLVGLDVTGVQRLSREQVLALSGLKTGRSVTAKDIAAANVRLADTGLFAKTTYRIRTTGGGYSVTVNFVVEELRWDASVFFDNFVGITDAQLTAAVAASLPTFDGLAPGSPAALERVRIALQRAAADAGEPGTVSYILIDDELLGIRHYRYRLERAAGPLRVCRVAVNNAVDNLRAKMTSRTDALVGTEFSRDYVTRYAMQNLVAMDVGAGYLRARVTDVQASRTAAGSGTCEGVDVAITIEDGARYRWAGAAWNGATVFTITELDRLLGLRLDEPADGARIANAAEVLRAAYATKGHLNIRVEAQRSFDDTQGRVGYAFRIDEGPQFRMGTLQIEGLPADQTERVRQMWELPEGQVFNRSYLTDFVARVQQSLRAVLARAPVVETRVNPDRRRLVVDVVIAFRL